MSRELLGATDPATVLGGSCEGPGTGSWDAGLLPGDAGSPRTRYCRGDSGRSTPGVPLRLGGAWMPFGPAVNPGPVRDPRALLHQRMWQRCW